MKNGKNISGPTLVIIALSIVALGVWVKWQPPAFDAALLRAIFEYRRPWLDSFFRIVTWAGSLYVLLPLSLLAGPVLFRRHWRQPTWELIQTLLGAALLTYLLKFIFDRPRPDTALIGTNLDYAFPSNHAAQVTAFMVMLIMLTKDQRPNSFTVLNIIALIMIALVGASRLYLQVHHPTDIIAGVLTGIAAALVIRRWAQTVEV